jgi:hypothetical protein
MCVSAAGHASETHKVVSLFIVLMCDCCKIAYVDFLT